MGLRPGQPSQSTPEHPKNLASRGSAIYPGCLTTSTEGQNQIKALGVTVSPQGFTLLEMLLVIAISAIVLATLVPNFGPAISRAQLTTATRDIASALRLTRALAISQGQDSTLEIDTNDGTYRVSGRPKTYSLPSGIELGLLTTSTETLDEGRGRVRFFPDGSATGGRVTLTGV